jgi:ABC-type cobalamin/Fe3+-siderophores transport system ATPase subunit
VPAQQPDERPEEPEEQTAVVARAIRVSGPWGPVYGPIDLTIPAGGLNVLVCPAGSGRTALMMTLAGRMRPTSGELTVAGARRAQDIFALSALAGVDELDTVPESVTVANLITEQLRWNASWYRLIPKADEAALIRVCAPVFGELPVPALGEYFEALSELDRLLLRIALANIRRPPMLVVGSVDNVTCDANRDLLIERLIDLGGSQTVVTATVNGAGAHPVRSQLAVPNTDRAELSDLRKGTG